MPSTPTFLKRLDLPGDADERAIKRAYARELKLIDQERDADDFQRLREAYEAALVWARRRSATDTADIAPTAPAGEARAAAADVRMDAAPGLAPIRADAASREPAALELAEQVLLDVVAAIQSRPADLTNARTALERATADPRLLRIEARESFEALIVDRLVRGWVPGNDALFNIAITLFDWKDDRRRLLRFGAIGVHMDRAVTELAIFEEQPEPLREKQMSAIRRVRTDRTSNEDLLFKLVPVLDQAAASFPTLVPMITDAENVRFWLIRGSRFRKAVQQPSPATTKKVRRREWSPKYFFIWMAVMVLVRCGSALNSGTSSARVGPKGSINYSTSGSGQFKPAPSLIPKADTAPFGTVDPPPAGR